MARTHEEIQETLRRESALVGLAKHPSWEVVGELVAVRRQQIENEIVRLTLVEKGPIDPLLLSKFRGEYAGVAWVPKHINAAEHRLERVLREQRVLEGVTS